MSKAKKTTDANAEGEKRVSKLTPEERKERARVAAKAMWEKKRAAKELAAKEQESIAADATKASRKVKAAPVPKEFSKALAAAEKDYAKSLEQLMFHEEMAAMLRARIPFLTQAIRALGGSVGSAAEANGAVALRGPEINYPPPENLPVIPVARGGSMGVINDAKTAEDENQFLRDAESVGAGGGWK